MQNILLNYWYNEDMSPKRNGVVVECGTAEGHHEPSKTLEEEFGWRFYGFEADPRFYSILEKNRPNATTLNLALSDKTGKSSFTISAHGGNSSLQHCEWHKKELEQRPAIFSDGTNTTKFVDIEVETITWNDFTYQYKLNEIDLFILDVEGSELKVLSGFDESSILPSVVQIEFGYLGDDEKYEICDIRYGDFATKAENFSGFMNAYNRLYELGYDFDYVEHNNAIFSLRSFWKNKTKPKKWNGETTQFNWNGVCLYDKDKCEKLINDTSI